MITLMLILLCPLVASRGATRHVGRDVVVNNVEDVVNQFIALVGVLLVLLDVDHQCGGAICCTQMSCRKKALP